MGCLPGKSAVTQKAASGSDAPKRIQADEGKIAALVDMGFSDKFARTALEACANDIEKATEHATKLTAAESASRFQTARDLLADVEADIQALESERAAADAVFPPEQKRVARLLDFLSRASVALDGVNVGGDSEMRNSRRAELQRCDSLENRIKVLRGTPQPTQQPVDAVPQGTEADQANPACSVVAENVAQNVDPATQVQTAEPVIGGRVVKEDDLPLLVEAVEPAAAGAASIPSPAQAHQSVSGQGQAGAGVAAAGGPDPFLPAEMRINGAEVMRLAGNDAFKAGNYEVAASRYREALSLDGEDVAISSNLAAVEIKLGEFENALLHAEVAVRHSGGFSAKALFRKGQALAGLQRVPEALAAYEAAVALEPHDAIMQQRLDECRRLASSPAAA